jgi:oligopeptide transport system permease protein
MAFAGLIILFVLIAAAAVGPSLSPFTYYEIQLNQANQAPNKLFWFGSDDLGRDVFTRIWYGARISLFVGFVAACFDLIIGVTWGAIAAFVGGKVEEIMMRITDILYAIPYLLLVILMMMALGSGLIPIIAALAVTNWINMARIVRSQILQLKQQEYVLAATALGAGFFRIVYKHLIPNTIGPIVVTMTFSIPNAIFTEAFLSFLGLGVQAPFASWGTMANEGLSAMRYYPWRLFFPAIFICLTILAFNLVGDGLRDALDPKQKKVE